MTHEEQKNLEAISGKLAAYDLILAHLLRKVLAQMSETGISSLREDLLRQMNSYPKNTEIPEQARLTLRDTVTDIWQKAEFEFRNQKPHS